MINNMEDKIKEKAREIYPNQTVSAAGKRSAFIKGAHSRDKEIAKLKGSLSESFNSNVALSKKCSDLQHQLKEVTEWINMEAEYCPDYYKPVLIKYTDKESRLITSVASMVSDGDKYFWDIIGTDITISDNDVHLWRKI